MKRDLLHLLICPICRHPFTLQAFEAGEEVERGVLLCQCGRQFPIVESVPRILLDPLPDQVRESYSFKWTRMPTFGLQRPELVEFYDDWFRRKLGLPDPETFERHLKGLRMILDAGTGLGAKVETICRISPGTVVIGVDFSESVGPAFANTRHYPNAHIVQADLHRLPFREGIFDLIVSDGVLHHTPDPQEAFKALIPYLAARGEVAIHVYKKLGTMREFCDDRVREHATKLTADACWEFTVPFTKLGKALSELKVEIEVPEDIPALGIKAGKYDLQRFIYYYFFKCFWHADFSFEENNLVNFDWYHPAHAYRHTEEEVLSWFHQAGLVETQSHQASESGVSVRGRKR